MNPSRQPPRETIARVDQPLGMPPARFLRDYWQKHPLLIRNAFADFTPPLTPDDLAGLACEETALSRIVLRECAAAFTTSSFRGRASARNPESSSFARRQELDDSRHPWRSPDGPPSVFASASLPSQSGSPLRGVRNDDIGEMTATDRNDRWSVRHGPFAVTDFAKLPKSHWSLLVQDVDKWDADVAALLDRFTFLPGWRVDDVMVSYATNGGGVGAHVDQYDVFLLQGMGQRRWRISTDPRASKDFRDDTDLKLLREFTPTDEWMLQSGDMLYLPPGMPHEGVAIGECMTFSIGMRAPSASEMLIDLAGFIAERLPEEQRYTDPGLHCVRDTGEIDEAAFARVVEALPWLRVVDEEPKRVGGVPDFADELDASLLRTWFGCFITAYRSAHTAAPTARAVSAKEIDAKLERSTFARHPWSRFAFYRAGRNTALFVAGEKYACPLAWARALAGRERLIDGARLTKLPQRVAGVAVLAALIGAGHLHRLRG